MANLQWRRLVQQRVLEKRQILASDISRDPTMVDGFPHPYIFVAAGRRLRLEELFAAVEILETRGWVPVSWHLVAEIRGVVMRGRPPGPAPQNPLPALSPESSRPVPPPEGPRPGS
jgi:hypothetical protein